MAGKGVKRGASSSVDGEAPFDMGELTEAQELFCVRLASDIHANQTKAYQWAYPDSSYDAARSSAPALLANPRILARVNELRAARAQRLEIDGDKILKLLVNDAQASIQDLTAPDGSFIPVHELDPDVARSIQSIEVEEIIPKDGGGPVCYVRKVKMVDRNKARELLGKNLLLWKDVGSKENPLVTMSEADIDAKLAELEAKAR